jgi:squalene-hopene/tetraprenyl-beta-curcumene cyclase
MVYNPKLEPGGFSFGYLNTWYPDVDDTAAAVVVTDRGICCAEIIYREFHTSQS